MAKQKETVSTAIRKVLGDAQGPMKAAEIAKLVVPMVPGLKGKTPAATVAAKVYTEAKRKGGYLKKKGDGFVLVEAKAEVEGETETGGGEGGDGDDDGARSAEEISPIEGAVVITDGSKRPERAQPDPRPSKAPRGRRAATRMRV